MDNSGGATYVRAGVDIAAAADAVGRMKEHISATRVPGVLSAAIGSFGGMFALRDAMVGDDPVLVSSIDGVGTKLKIAFLTGKHDTIGRDLVFHCVNDILVQGARPLFFLDYFGTGKLAPTVAASVVKGLAQGCRAVGCALVGGETAEMPGMYAAGEYDLAGCIVGVVDRGRIVDGCGVGVGDAVIGLASDGLHTNGYSLARKALMEDGGLKVDDFVPELGQILGEALLAPHRCYAPAILDLLGPQTKIKAMAHITGGGLTDNVPRSLPHGLGVNIKLGSWPIPQIFTLIQKAGHIAPHEMHHVFNMGVGYAIVTSSGDKEELLAALNNAGERAYLIGEVRKGSGVTID